MAKIPAPLSLVRSSAASLPVCLAIFALAGCTTTPATPKKLCEGVVLVSQNGASLYAQAQKAYAEVRLTDPQGPTRDSQMSQVMRLLDGAITNDSMAVLFHSKLADMRLESGQVDRAGAGYEKCRAMCRDWVPAWLGLAAVAARQGDFNAADSYLQSARLALNNVQNPADEKKDEPDFFAILGLNLDTSSDEQPDPDDPTLDKDGQLRLLVNWLQSSEAWTIENPDLVQTTGGKQVVESGRLMRRLRARIEYHAALVLAARGANSTEVFKALDYALQWDPDFFAAKIEKAALLHKIGEFQAAERLLRPYVDSANELLSSNAPLLLEMASIYTDWYVHTKESATADLADAYFAKLHEVNPDHASGYIKRAELYLTAGTELKRSDTLNTAVQCLDRAKQTLGRDTAEAAALRTKLADAQAKVGG